MAPEWQKRVLIVRKDKCPDDARTCESQLSRIADDRLFHTAEQKATTQKLHTWQVGTHPIDIVYNRGRHRIVLPPHLHRFQIYRCIFNHFYEIGPKTTEFGEITQTTWPLRRQGHSRSPI